MLIHKNEEFFFLAEQLSKMLGMGRVIEIREKPMDACEKGFSGAEIFRMECLLESGKKTVLFVKKPILRSEWS